MRFIVILITALVAFPSFADTVTISDVHSDMRNNLDWSPNNLWDKDIIIDLGYTINFCASDVCLAKIEGVSYRALYITKDNSIYAGMNLKGKTVTYDGIQHSFMTFKIK